MIDLISKIKSSIILISVYDNLDVRNIWGKIIEVRIVEVINKIILSDRVSNKKQT